MNNNFKFTLTLVMLSIVAFALLIIYIAAQLDVRTESTPQKPAAVEQRAYLCLVPYSHEYCAANQDQMYREQAMRER